MNSITKIVLLEIVRNLNIRAGHIIDGIDDRGNIAGLHSATVADALNQVAQAILDTIDEAEKS